MTTDLHLWRAVVAQAITDATSDAQTGNADHDRRQARSWLTRPSADFAEVCALAGLEPEAVRAYATKLIAACKPLDSEVKPKRQYQRKPKPLRKITIDARGMSLTIAEWSKTVGIDAATLSYRINAGWPIERALSKPTGRTGHYARRPVRASIN